MRLESCDIAGFGKFKNTHFDFSQGLNASLEENGWGKTTLLVFIKAMLFGMEFSRKRLVLTEREHYRPWDSESYGGSLNLDIDGTSYRIERTFGKKQGEDSFDIFDNVTGRRSEDYTENIGQELFGVDRASFEKSVFVMQSALETGMTDSLNAKIGDMSQAQDDINNFDDAIKNLEAAKKVYTKNSKLDPGKLILVRQEIRKCKEALEQIPAQADAMAKQRDVLDEKRKSLNAQNEKKAKLLEAITAQSKRENQIGAYRQKKETKEKLLSQTKEAEKFFSRLLPTREDIDELDEVERRLEKNRDRINVIEEDMPEDDVKVKLKKLFDENVPDDVLIEEMEDKAEKVLSLRIKGEHSKMSDEDSTALNELKSYFSKKNPTFEEIEKALQDATELVQLDGQTDALREQYRSICTRNELQGGERREAGRPSAFLYGWIGAAVMLLGAVVSAVLLEGTWRIILSVIFAVAAVTAAGLMASLQRRSKKGRNARFASMRQQEEEALKALNTKEAERDEKKKICLEFLDGFLVSPTDNYVQMIGEIQRKKELYDRLLVQEENMVSSSEGALEELAKLQMELYTPLMGYANVYGMDLYDEHKESELLEMLKEDKKLYEKFVGNSDELKKLHESVDEDTRRLDEFLKAFVLPTESVKDGLLEIRRKLDHYETDRNELSNISQEIEEFERSNNIDEKTKSVEQLQKEQEVIDAEIADLNEQIIKANETMAEITDELEELEEIGDNLSYLKEQEAECRKKVELYDDTMEYLTRAKEAFLARYMGPLRSGLTRYVSMIQGADTAAVPLDSVTLDMDLKVKLLQNTGTKSSDYLSSGYRDMLFICARLALLDVMYGKEQPFLVLDDPFSNLDADKIKKALELLGDIAKERQVIYYTCHSSRMPRR